MDALPQRAQEASAAAAGGQGPPQRKETCVFFQAAPLLRHGGRERHGHHEAVPDWQHHRHSAADVTQYNTAFSFGACAWSPC